MLEIYSSHITKSGMTMVMLLLMPSETWDDMPFTVTITIFEYSLRKSLSLTT